MFNKSLQPASWRVCVAPMIDVTDRHCRYFHRLLHPKARLYTEMLSTGALLHGSAARHLALDPAEHPVALQLGGSVPDELARAAKLGEQAGYDEINLNCGCPSDRVQRGAFGACLMAQAELVADCVRAMQDAVSVPVTVKHRLGLDYDDSYSFVRDFVGTLYEAGCRVFIVHARNAVLKGLSPKGNREIPPLRYDRAAQLKQDFPDCVFVLNGGISTVEQSKQHLETFDGVMLGRAAWHDPSVLTRLWHTLEADAWHIDEDAVVASMVDYTRRQVAAGQPMRLVIRSMLDWASGKKGARRWRQHLSDAKALSVNDPEALLAAWEDLKAASKVS